MCIVAGITQINEVRMGQSGSLQSKDKTMVQIGLGVEEDLVSCDHKYIQCGVCGCFSRF